MGRGVDACIVLAAGKGTRMRSRIPKVLHPLLGRPMLSYVLETAREVARRVVVVTGPGDKEVGLLVDAVGAEAVVQHHRLGTAHAAGVGLGRLGHEGTVLVLCGDTPLLGPATLRALAELHQERDCAMSVLSCTLDRPEGYGRILREEGRFVGIVEEEDATDAQRRIQEVNTGVHLFTGGFLRRFLPEVTPENVQGEYYLTDLAGIGLAAGERVEAFPIATPQEALGINDRVALAAAEEQLLTSLRERWMMEGVTMINPSTIYIEPSVALGRDVVIGPGAVLKGATRVGDGARIGANAVLESVEVPPGAEVHPNSWICENYQKGGVHGSL